MENTENNAADRGLYISRTINAPIDLVWEVWTKPEHIANWWGPNGFTNTITLMDIKPGGEWHLVMHGPDGTDYTNKSIFREVEFHQKLVYEHFAPNFIATVEFEAQGDKTELKWQMVFESADVFLAVVKAHKADEGLKQNVVKLDAYLQGLK